MLTSTLPVNSTAIIIGLREWELQDIKELDKLVRTTELEVAAPYQSDNVVGLVYTKSMKYQSVNVEIDLEEIDWLKSRFKTLTGKDAIIILTPNGK